MWVPALDPYTDLGKENDAHEVKKMLVISVFLSFDAFAEGPEAYSGTWNFFLKVKEITQINVWPKIEIVVLI